ncbi:MAG: acetolactate synthase small subunit, partial [Gammaproteobacteria bacterium]|nr:acetolactate synthase small subunit [Gammaproteobacteria bacterium]
KLMDMTEGPHIEREMMLVKVNTQSKNDREEVKRLADIFRGRIIDVTKDTYTIELTESCERLNAFLESLGNVSILEVVRSGVIGIIQGDKALTV